MIKIDYVCGFANRLFQYSIANIIAQRHGLMLPVSPIDGIPRSYKAVDGIKLQGEPEVVETTSDIRIILDRKTITRPLLLRGLFQMADLYLKNTSEIKNKWIKLHPNIQPAENTAECDLVIHVRRGDYLLHNWGAPFSYYQEALESTSFHNICIITDDLHDPFLRRFQRFKPTIVCSHYLNDFACLTKARKIIMSPSTFSWWGAFISNAEEIFFPIPCHGIWSTDYSNDVDLVLPNTYKQYKYLRCNEPLKLNPIERIYFEKKFFTLKIQNYGVSGYIKSHVQSSIKIGRQLLRWNT